MSQVLLFARLIYSHTDPVFAIEIIAAIMFVSVMTQDTVFECCKL